MRNFIRLFVCICFGLLLVFASILPVSAATSESAAAASISSVKIPSSVTEPAKAKITFKVSKTCDITLKVLNSTDEIVSEYAYNNVAAKKIKTVYWDCKATAGNQAGYDEGSYVPAGKYTIYISTGQKSVKKYINVLKALRKPQDITITASSGKYIATWDSVSHASGYILKLYKGSKCVKTRQVGVVCQSDITSVLKSSGKGKYYVAVAAKGNKYYVNSGYANSPKFSYPYVQTVPVTGVDITTDSVELSIGSSTTLTADVLPSNATNRKVSWSSDNLNVATVNNGVVIGRGVGSATITATTDDGNFKDTCIVTVKARNIPVAGITLNRTRVDASIEDEFTLVPSIIPSNATNKTVIWTSDNTAVAAVNNGLVEANAVGTATIKATTQDGGYSASCFVTVKPLTEYLTDGDYYFYIKDGGKALNLNASSDSSADKDGTKVTVWKPTQHTTQRFRVQNIGNNKCRILAISSINNGNSRVLDVNRANMGGLMVGDYIDIWHQSLATDQEWIISKTSGEEYYKIELAYIPGAVVGCSTPGTDGSRCQLQTFNGSASQLWKAEAIPVHTYLWPTPELTKITSYFGMRKDPITGENRMHYGIDIAGANAYGKRVLSIGDGKVIKKAYTDNLGYYLIVDHGGQFYSVYQHLSSYASDINVGSTVSKGQLIAYVGSTGRVTGPHLHFGIMVGGNGSWNAEYFVNPLNYVSP